MATPVSGINLDVTETHSNAPLKFEDGSYPPVALLLPQSAQTGSYKSCHFGYLPKSLLLRKMHEETSIWVNAYSKNWEKVAQDQLEKPNSRDNNCRVQITPSGLPEQGKISSMLGRLPNAYRYTRKNAL